MDEKYSEFKRKISCKWNNQTIEFNRKIQERSCHGSRFFAKIDRMSEPETSI